MNRIYNGFAGYVSLQRLVATPAGRSPGLGRKTSFFFFFFEELKKYICLEDIAGDLNQSFARY